MKLLSAIQKFNDEASEHLTKIGITDQSSFMHTEDLNVWAGREVLTVKDFDKWIDLYSTYSDRYKDLWNCRPINLPSTLSDLTWAHENITTEFERERQFELSQKREAAYERKMLAAKDRFRKERANNFGAMAVHEELSKAFSKFV